jgi:RimJ/RimL family protein N-acetyltransferase
MDKETWFQNYHNEMLQRPVRWHFPPIPPTAHLTFERLTRGNAERCWAMFPGDTNPFLDEYFTDRQKFEEYIGQLCDYMPRSLKHGGADWLVCRRGDGDGDVNANVMQDVGILHVYDLSLENFDDSLERCTIGFVTAAPFRRQGVMREAVPHFVEYIAREIRRPRVLAYAKRDNAASVALLRSLDFTPCDDEYRSEKNHFFRYIVHRYIVQSTS